MITVPIRESVTLVNRDKRLFGMFHAAGTKEKAPGVVILHGFGGGKCGRHRVYVALSEMLAAEGINVLRFDFRGCGDSLGDFRDISISGEVEDASIALDWLKQRPEVDSERLGLVGSSFGGVIATLTATQRSEVKALVVWCPPFQPTDYWRSLWDQYAGHLDRAPSLADCEIRFQGDSASALFFKQFFDLKMEKEIQKIANVPMLHLQGSLDESVTPLHAAYYEESRKSAQAESRFVALKNSNHDFSDAVDRQQLLDETVNWFKRYL